MKFFYFSCEGPSRSLHVEECPEKGDWQIHDDDWPDPFGVADDPFRIFRLAVFIRDVRGVVHEIIFGSLGLKLRVKPGIPTVSRPD